MGLASENNSEINNQVSAVLRILRYQYKNDVKLQITDALCIQEFKLKILRKDFGYYKFLFIIKIPREYPYEPMWAEPVIVNKAMMMQFYNEEFKCFKLKPLVDSLVVFCHKYDKHNFQSAQISFPVTRLFGKKEITTKVLFLLNRALSKISNRFTFDISQYDPQNSLLSYYLSRSGDFYNDMGSDMFNYINMLNHARNRSKKHKKDSCEKSVFINKGGMDSVQESSTKNIKRYLSKTACNILSYRPRSELHCDYRKDLNQSKLNLSKMRNLIELLQPISSWMIEIDFLEEFSVEINEEFGISVQYLSHMFSIKQDILCMFANLIEYPSNLKENQLKKKKIVLHGQVESKALVSIHSREIILPRNIYMFIINFIKYFLSVTKTENGESNLVSSKKENEPLNLEESIPYCIIEPIRTLNVFPIFTSLRVEEAKLGEINISYIYSVITNNYWKGINSNMKIWVFNDSKYLKQPFLKDRIAQQIILKNDLINSDFRLINSPCKPLKTEIIKQYSEIISEVIQYPKNETDLFIYTLELNPRSARHRILLEDLGLLKYKHYSQLEIITSIDYNNKLFFLKENFNPNGRGVVIKLHKISPKNIIYNLILEENNYIQNLSVTNRSVWCTEVASTVNLGLVPLIFNLGKMYVQKLQRRRKMQIEASALNCSDLAIQRYHFSNELVQALSIF